MRNPIAVLRRFAAACFGLPLAAGLFAADPDAIEKSKKEEGVLIYGNVTADDWGPALAAFRKKYPWIKVDALDLGPTDCFERYYAESSVGRHSADLIVAGAPSAWLRFMKKEGPQPYEAADIESLPEWTRPYPGFYTFSTDPLVLVYNKLLLPPERQPKSLEHLAKLSRKHPEDFRGRITTYDAGRHTFAYAIHWAYVNQLGEEGWERLEKLGAYTRPEGAGASMIEKVTTGEYTTVFFGSGLTFLKRILEGKGSDILGWGLIEDGTPIMMRGIAITKQAKSKYSAQLLLDFLLSHDGQVALAKGGITPYRDDVRADEVPFLTLAGIREKIGEKNMLLIGYDEQMLSDEDEFVARWKAVFAPKR